MKRRLTARPRGVRTMVASGVMLLVGGTMLSPSDAAVRVPERAAPVAAALAQDGRWAGELPDTNYPVPGDAIHVAVSCAEQASQRAWLQRVIVCGHVIQIYVSVVVMPHHGPDKAEVFCVNGAGFPFWTQ